MINVPLMILDERVRQWGGMVRGSKDAAAFDLFACTYETHNLGPGAQYTFSAGVAMHIGANTAMSVAGLIIPRSGLGRKGIVLSNGTGLIDPDYQGCLGVALWNRSQECITINPGDRIAQLLIVPVLIPEFAEVSAFEATERGSGSFGSSGR